MKKLFFQIVLPLLGIAGILGFILTANPIQQQRAAVAGDHTDSCNLVNVSFTEPNPTSNNTSYAPYAIVSLINRLPSDNDQITIDWDSRNYFCPTSNDIETACTGNPPGCYGKNGTTTGMDNQSCQLTNANPTCKMTVPAIAPSGAFSGQVCGHFQSDFAFNFHSGSYGGNGCHYGSVLAVACNPGGATYNSFGDCAASTPTATPTTIPQDCDRDQDNSPASDCVTPTATMTPTATPTSNPTATPTTVSNNGCNNTTQVGVNNNSNCNTNTQSQSQTQNNNQTVNITLGNGQQQQQQQVLAATSHPTQLPSTGAGSDVLFGLLALIPVGWKIRKLI